MGSPAVHHAESLNDALTMLDSRIPLTHRERKLIVESLYDLAFREGARQGRQAGMESVYSEIRKRSNEPGTSAIVRAVLETLLPPDRLREYTEPTVAIRRTLEDKQRAVSALTHSTTDNFAHPYPEHG